MLAGVRSASMSDAIAYARGALRVEDLPATSGEPAGELTGELGAMIDATLLDWIVAPADLAAFGEPAVGDRIETAGDEIYEVLDLAGQGHWRWSGPPGVAWRIHTKRIA
jgi:hypothetical protein